MWWRALVEIIVNKWFFQDAIAGVWWDDSFSVHQYASWIPLADAMSQCPNRVRNSAHVDDGDSSSSFPSHVHLCCSSSLPIISPHHEYPVLMSRYQENPPKWGIMTTSILLSADLSHHSTTAQQVLPGQLIGVWVVSLSYPLPIRLLNRKTWSNPAKRANNGFLDVTENPRTPPTTANWSFLATCGHHSVQILWYANPLLFNRSNHFFVLSITAKQREMYLVFFDLVPLPLLRPYIPSNPGLARSLTLIIHPITLVIVYCQQISQQ